MSVVADLFIVIFMLLFAWQDWRTHLVDDRLVLSGLVCLLPFQILLHGWQFAVYGMLAGVAVSLLVYYGARLLRPDREAFGAGDVTASAFVGLACGWYGFIFVFFAAHLFHVLIGMVYVVRARRLDVGAPFLPAYALAVYADLLIPGGIASVFRAVTSG